jgi:hypothetical protein
LLVAACSDETTPTTTTLAAGSGAESATEAVNELVTAINEPDFDAASELAMPGQAALASLAEGASFAVVADALRTGDRDVAANFWSGFAQGTQNFLTGPVEVTLDGAIEQGGIEFEVVRVVPGTGGARTVVARDDDGYRIDLFASFGAGLADKMVTPVERLLTTQTEDARLILSSLQDIVPSLLAAAGMSGTPVDVSQQLIALVEVITRVG